MSHRRRLVEAVGGQAGLAEQCENGRLLHQELPRLDLVRGGPHQRQALVDPTGLEIDAAQEPGGLRTQERDVRMARDAARALEHGAGSVEVSPDEGDVPQPDAGGGKTVRAVEPFSDGDRLAAGGHPLVELPALRETTREPGEVHPLKRPPGPDHQTGERARPPFDRWRLDDGPQQLRGAPVIAESMTGQPEDIAGDEPEREVLQPVAQDQRLLRELARLGESPALAEVFAHDRGDQPEPALIRDRTGKGLGLPQARQHLLELAERVERGPQLKAHIDLLLSRFRRLGQVA